MTFGGGGEQPTHIPDRQHSEPHIRGPEDPQSDGRMLMELLVKWGAIALVAGFLVLFVYLAINGIEDESELSDEQAATLEARRN